jgi:VanZ family protein
MDPLLGLVCGLVLGLALGAACYGLFFVRPATWEQRLAWLLWPQLALMALITLLAYLGQLPRTPLDWPHADKVIHFLLFGALVFWLNLWLGGRTVKRLPLALLVAFGCALLEELAQSLSPLRSLELLDLASDLAGMVVFYLASQRLLRWLQSRRPRVA